MCVVCCLCCDSNNDNDNNNDDINEVAFVAAGSSQTSSSRADYLAKMECFICGKKGHSMYKCDNVSPKDRDRHIADHKQNVMLKVSAAKKADSTEVVTQTLRRDKDEVSHDERVITFMRPS